MNLTNKTKLSDDAKMIRAYLVQAQHYEDLAREYLQEMNLSTDDLLEIWNEFDSRERAALKRTK